MDLFDVVRAAFRRWYVFLPLIAVAAAFAYHLYSSAKPVYYVNAVVGMAPPNAQVQYTQPGVPILRNGLLDSGGPAFLANLLVLGLRDNAVRGQVLAGGGKPNYTVSMFPGPVNAPQLPLVMVDATEPDPGSATKTVELVIAQSGDVLRNIQRQAGVSEDQMVRVIPATAPTAPVGAVPSRTRSAIAVLAAGAGLAMVLSVVLDVLLTRRRRRRAAPGAPQSAAPSVGDDNGHPGVFADHRVELPTGAEQPVN